MIATRGVSAYCVLELAWKLLLINEKALSLRSSAKRRVACRRCVNEFEETLNRFAYRVSSLEDDALKAELVIALIKKLNLFEKKFQQLLWE